MKDKTYVFFDTETTGLPNDFNAPFTDSDNWPRLVQLAWIVTDEAGKHIDEQNFIIKPDGFEIPEDVLEIHGITTEKAEAEGHYLAGVLADFWKVVAFSDFIVAHNISFDVNIVAAEFHRIGMSNIFRNERLLDTKKAGADICKIPNPHDYEGYKWPRLKELYRHLFGEDFENAHDAFADITATERCFWKMREINAI
ncbi:3'-5' exonuclease [uncultured Draconibacterium sp.]|uniref:3'-5' exonuclease n=1 Tax=uncultured Draconibacterium sp. TaxID=1573823 RepID=UPI00326168E7